MTHPHPPATLALLTQVAPWHNSLRHTHPHPTAYEKEKKIVRPKKKNQDENDEEGRERNGSGTTALPMPSSPTCFTLSVLAQAQQPYPPCMIFCLTFSIFHIGRA